MACHEIAALRLGLMRLLGETDEAERQHELSELGDGASCAGPVKSLCEASDLASLRRFFGAALADLNGKVAKVESAGDGDPKLAYYRTLIVLTKKVELDLDNQIDGLSRLYRDLDEMHDFVHEIYPAAG
jgi:hypothetical protein